MSMVSSFGKLINILAKSDLTIEEQDELMDFLTKAKEEDLKEVVDFLTENPGWTRKIYHNYRVKKEALDKRDRVLWGKIISQEIEDLNAIHD